MARGTEDGKKVTFKDGIVENGISWGRRSAHGSALLLFPVGVPKLEHISGHNYVEGPGECGDRDPGVFLPTQVGSNGSAGEAGRYVSVHTDSVGCKENGIGWEVQTH